MPDAHPRPCLPSHGDQTGVVDTVTPVSMETGTSQKGTSEMGKCENKNKKSSDLYIVYYVPDNILKALLILIRLVLKITPSGWCY